jgi:hypothetical protein
MMSGGQCGFNGFKLGQQGGQLVQWKRIGAVTKGLVRIFVNFQKNAVGTRCNGGPGKGGRKLPLAAGTTSRAAGQLNAMGGVEDRPGSPFAA